MHLLSMLLWISLSHRHKIVNKSGSRSVIWHLIRSLWTVFVFIFYKSALDTDVWLTANLYVRVGQQDHWICGKADLDFLTQYSFLTKGRRGLHMLTKASRRHAPHCNSTSSSELLDGINEAMLITSASVPGRCLSPANPSLGPFCM